MKCVYCGKAIGTASTNASEGGICVECREVKDETWEWSMDVATWLKAEDRYYFFAGCALIGILAGRELYNYGSTVNDVWEMADHMMKGRQTDDTTGDRGIKGEG